MTRTAQKQTRTTTPADIAGYRPDHPFGDPQLLTPDERRRMALLSAGSIVVTALLYAAFTGGSGDRADTDTPPSTIVHTVIKGESPYSIVENEIRTGLEDPTVEISPDEVHRMLADVALLNGKAVSNFTAVYPDQEIIIIDVPDAVSNAARVQSGDK